MIYLLKFEKRDYDCLPLATITANKRKKNRT